VLVGEEEGLAVFDAFLGGVEGGEEGGQGSVFFRLQGWREGGREGGVERVRVPFGSLLSYRGEFFLLPSLPPSLPPLPLCA